MKKYWGWSLVGGLFAGAALLLDIIIVAVGADLNFLTVIANVVLGLLGLLFWQIGKAKKKKQRRIRDKQQREQAKQRFEKAEVLDTNKITDLFIQEFNIVEIEGDAEDETAADPEEMLRRMDRELNFTVAVESLMGFARERGVVLDRSAVASILSSFAASRLIFVNSLHGEELNRCLAVLSEYFGGSFYAQTIVEQHREGGQLLFVKDENGANQTTEVLRMLSHAREHREQIHFAVLNGVRAEALSDLLVSYIRYFNNPIRENSVSVKGMTTNYALSENLWFVVELAEGESFENVPSHLSELGTLLSPDYTPCEEAETLNPYRTVGYYELMHMADQSKARTEMKEDLWKKVDGLEGYVNGHSPYQIGNKLSLRMETYLSVYCACGYEIPEALDHALAANLLPMMMAVLKDRVRNDERSLLETVEQLFGEDNVGACRKVLKDATV